MEIYVENIRRFLCCIFFVVSQSRVCHLHCVSRIRLFINRLIRRKMNVFQDFVVYRNLRKSRSVNFLLIYLAWIMSTQYFVFAQFAPYLHCITITMIMPYNYLLLISHVRHSFPYICVLYVSLVDVKKLCASYLLWISDFVSGRISSRGVIIACRLFRFIFCCRCKHWLEFCCTCWTLHTRCNFGVWDGEIFLPSPKNAKLGGRRKQRFAHYYYYLLTPDLCLFLIGSGYISKSTT